MSTHIVGLLAAVVLAAPLPFDPKAREGVAFPWGVADAAGQRAYIRSAEGGILALDLAKGESFWQVRHADIPLHLSGKVLLARANVPNEPARCRIVALDVTEKGKELFRSDVISFPNVIPDLFQKRDFHVDLKWEKNEILLRWVGIGQYTGGVPPPDDLRNDLEKQSGIARIDPATGKARVILRKDLASEKLPQNYEKWAKTDVDPSRWETAVTIAGITYELAIGGEGFRRKTTLVARETGKEKPLWERLLEDVELPPPPP